MIISYLHSKVVVFGVTQMVSIFKNGGLNSFLRTFSFSGCRLFNAFSLSF